MSATLLYNLTAGQRDLSYGKDCFVVFITGGPDLILNAIL
jgi:hypothetical protein